MKRKHKIVIPPLPDGLLPDAECQDMQDGILRAMRNCRRMQRAGIDLLNDKDNEQLRRQLRAIARRLDEAYKFSCNIYNLVVGEPEI